MTVSTGQLIIKANRDNLIGIINDFNSRIVQTIYSKIQYHSGHMPHFIGTAYYGKTGNFGNESTLGWTNPIAMPNSQLTAIDTQPALTITDSIITASTLWNNMLNITRALSKIRYFTTNWYHKTEDTRNLVNSISGGGIFNTAFPAVPGGADGNQSKTEFWERKGNTTPNVTPPTEIVKEGLVSANSMNNTISNCYNTWQSQCFNAGGLVYNFYTCHSNCHGSCHASRGRR